MGDCGLATRVLAGRFGSAWTYAGALREHRPADARTTLLDDYHFRVDRPMRPRSTASSARRWRTRCRPRCTTRRFARPASTRSISRCPRPTPTISIAFARAIGISGASVTIPLKVSLFERVDEVDAVARRIGAINTIRVADGRWIGGNTDAPGFLEPLQERVSLARVARVRAGRRRRGAGRGGGARLERLRGPACTRATARRRKTSRPSLRSSWGRGRRRRGAGICWSTARRSACIRRWTTRRCRRTS